MHIDIIPNRGSRPAYLLRESFREGQRVRKRTLANLSSLSDEQIFAIRAILRGETLAPATGLFEAIASRTHGHVQAVRRAMQQLGFAQLIGTRPSAERDRVCAMVAARILAPHTKLATTRWWHTTTLAQEFGVEHADEDDLYGAMDWLLERQAAIEKKLAKRHLSCGGLVLYDLSSSYFEGTCCPLAKLGHNRDGKKGKLQVNYGLVTDARGCPVAVSVFEGDTADCKTVLPQVRRIQADFGIESMVVVGDRGMISQKAIDEFKRVPGVAWITAMKSAQFALWWTKAACRWACSMSAICSSSRTRTTRASGWSPAAIRSSRNCAQPSALTCCRRPQPSWIRYARWWRERSSQGPTRSACAWAGWSTNTRSPSTSS
ncbi:MAG: transposase [Betaproteobacteria bacterium]|nr:transposase [Betaproteobacteria bacterium]